MFTVRIYLSVIACEYLYVYKKFCFVNSFVNKFKQIISQWKYGLNDRENHFKTYYYTHIK